MAKRNKTNQRVKRKYLVWRGDAKGHSEATLIKVAASLSVYDAYLDGKDYRTFHPERARAFKRHLLKTRSKTTVNGILRDVMAFYHWLADQSGYKSRLDRSDFAYLTPDRKSDNAQRGNLWKPHPSPLQARDVIAHMRATTVIERRNRALVALLFLTASRESAAISLSLGQVDMDNHCVHFDGRVVNTKFGKTFTTGFYPIGGVLVDVLQDWIQELCEKHLFSATDPLFPKTHVAVGPDRRFAANGLTRQPWSSPSSAVKIFKEAFQVRNLPPYSPHRVRDTIAELAKDFCRTPEDYKAWSQNMGHEDVMTTFRSYGSVAPGRQKELMDRFRCEADGDNDEICK